MPLACPACRKVAMKPRIDRETGLEIDSCPECHGLWFDYQELSRFLAGGSLKKGFDAVAESSVLDSIGFTLGTRTRKCPRCRLGMEERMFADVTLDVCPQCEGIWMDDGELQRVLAKYQAGAPGDEAIRRELDKGYGREGPSTRSLLAALRGIFRKG